MRTNIEIDDKLIKKAMKVAGVKTKKAAVEEALQRMIRIKAQGGILKLKGKIEFWDDVIEDRVANSVERPRVAKKAA